MNTLKDIYEAHMSKNMFLDYMARCSLMGMEPCSDAKFKVGRCNDIGLDIRDVAEERVDIPGFVNYLYRETKNWMGNDKVKHLNLNRVTTISTSGLSGFHALETLEAKHLTGIGFQGMTSCENLTELNLPKLEIVGQSGLAYCMGLKSLYAPRLTDTNQDWMLRCRSMKYIYAPELKILFPIYISNLCSEILVLKLVCNESTRILEQTWVGFIMEDDETVINWCGKVMGKKGDTLKPLYDLDDANYVKYMGATKYVEGLKFREIPHSENNIKNWLNYT